MVLKKDAKGNLIFKQLCLDLRYINKLLLDDKYPIPLIKDILEVLINIVIFITLDLLSIYYRFQIKLKDRYKIIFT